MLEKQRRYGLIFSSNGWCHHISPAGWAKPSESSCLQYITPFPKSLGPGSRRYDKRDHNTKL